MKHYSLNCGKPEAGFTLPEVLVAIVIVGVLAAVAAPNIIGFINRQEMISANEQALSAIRRAQNLALDSGRGWQVTFRQADPNVAPQWSIYETMGTQQGICPPSGVGWNDFSAVVRINSMESTLVTNGACTNHWFVAFNERGEHRPGTFGRITFQVGTNDTAQRCVFVNTLLGGTRVDATPPLDPSINPNGCN